MTCKPNNLSRSRLFLSSPMHHFSPTWIYFIWLTTSFQTMESLFFFGILKKLLFLIYFSLMILTQMLSLSMRIFHPSLVIIALLTSSFLLIHSPPSYLGLQTSSQATKGKPLESLDPTFGNHKKFLLILSRSSLFLFVSLKWFITWRGELAKLAFI